MADTKAKNDTATDEAPAERRPATDVTPQQAATPGAAISSPDGSTVFGAPDPHNAVATTGSPDANSTGAYVFHVELQLIHTDGPQASIEELTRELLARLDDYADDKPSLVVDVAMAREEGETEDHTEEAHYDFRGDARLVAGPSSPANLTPPKSA